MKKTLRKMTKLWKSDTDHERAKVSRTVEKMNPRIYIIGQVY